VNKFCVHSSPQALNVCTHYTVKLEKQHRRFVIIYRHGWTEAIGAPDRWGCGSMVTVLCAWSWLMSSYISSTVNGFRFYTTLTAAVVTGSSVQSSYKTIQKIPVVHCL